ncbi:hypothetical protein ACOZ4N_07875 [Halorientalis pallida]|uniref:hypothetical protein n=1 Tax=Halorientalis pallida TaxID=2479928 RepID=UPI003C6F61B1
MDDWRQRLGRGTDILARQAVRVPLPDDAAERTLHENMHRIADAGDRKAELLADPDVPLTDAYEYELDEMSQGFKHRLQQIVGEEYHAVADEYLRGERDDWIGALAVYYQECYCRLQERFTVDDDICVLTVLRYPDSFTVNFSFFDGEVAGDAIRYESPKHDESDLDSRYRDRYHAECQYSQRRAAEYIRERTDLIRVAFPDPAASRAEDRQYGGFVHITGRDGPVFSEVLESVTPDPDRFDEPATTPGLVPEGPEVERIRNEYLDDAELIV